MAITVGQKVRTPDGVGTVTQQINPECFAVEVDGIEDEYDVDAIETYRPANPTNPSWASAREARVRRQR